MTSQIGMSVDTDVEMRRGDVTWSLSELLQPIFHPVVQLVVRVVGKFHFHEAGNTIGSSAELKVHVLKVCAGKVTDRSPPRVGNARQCFGQEPCGSDVEST